MHKLFIAGNVGKDAELRTTQGGDPVLSFSVAVDNGKDRDGNRRSTWYDCSLWGKRAESLAPHIRKGDRLAVTGRPTVRVHEGRAYLGVVIEDLTFMGSAARPDSSNDRSGGTAAEYRNKQVTGARGPGGYGDIDDEIPFAPEWR